MINGSMVQALSAGCGVARGLSYFHREKKQDVKSEYIILITNNCRLTSNLTLTIIRASGAGRACKSNVSYSYTLFSALNQTLQGTCSCTPSSALV